jgi:putative SOS response-associated peptidase YedK
LCYTIEINLTREQLVRRFKANIDPETPFRKGQRINAFSLPDCPVICAEQPDLIQLRKWGLVPVWTIDEAYAKEIRIKTFNAKSETITTKPSFRHLIKQNKCLVLTNGFYEWQARGKEKQPYFINIKDTDAFALAGLYDTWINRETGEVFKTFTIITTAANPLMEKIHNTKKRMPVILHEKDEREWINPNLPLDTSLNYLKPFDENLMIAEEIDKQLFSRTKIDPVQPTLF